MKRSRLVALTTLTVLGMTACEGRKPAPPPPAPAPVVVATAKTADVPLEVSAVGHVEALQTVSIRPRVGGAIEAVHFREGDTVKKGDLLFTLDPRPFKAQLAAAQANLERDVVKLETARADARRYAELVAKDYVTREQHDQVVSNADSLAATVRADEAAVESARLDLDYARLVAPITGRAGSVLVHAGNLVKANDDRALVVLNQVQPIRVSLTVPEKRLADVTEALAKGPLTVDALTSGREEKVKGTLTFIDNAVDQTTGSVALKATFANESGALWPGQFVNVSLVLGIEKGVIVVPSAAIQHGQKGDFVFVVTDGTAEPRPVQVSRSNELQAVVTKGLAPGDVVVVDGQLRLAPGAKVEVKAPAALESRSVSGGGVLAAAAKAEAKP